MSNFMLEAREAAEDMARLWWLFLLTGIAWLIVAWLVFQWDYTTVSAISYLFGFVAIFFGINEFLNMGGSSTGWKIVHVLLGILFIVAGTVALFNPFETFAALAALIGLFLIVKGAVDVIVSIATRDEISVWWLQLTIGIVEILLGFWASGPGIENYGRQVVLLVIWVGAMCIARGITEIIFAFKLHRLKKDLGGFPDHPAIA